MELVLGEMIIFGPLYFRPPNALFFPVHPCPYAPYPPRYSSLITTRAKKRNSPIQPFLKQEFEEEYEGIEAESEQEVDVEYFEDEILVDANDTFEDEFKVDDTHDTILYVGDGGEGGGISLAGTWWDKKALDIAEEVSTSFDGDLKIYAFKTTVNSTIHVRIEKLSSRKKINLPIKRDWGVEIFFLLQIQLLECFMLGRYGSPSMTDIEAFSSTYREHLDEAECAGAIPENLSLEVSSPGVERVVRIPEELVRFKDKPMDVRYRIENNSVASTQENDGVFRLVSFDMDSCHCTWGIADVRANRKQAGKGRPLSKKQREWRLQTPFDSLILVRLHSDC